MLVKNIQFIRRIKAAVFLKNRRNDEVIGKLFSKVRKYCKKILFIQMPYSWDVYYERTLIMNEVFSKFCDASILLPLDVEFPAKYTLYNGIDRVHYTDEYHGILSDLVYKKINEMF